MIFMRITLLIGSLTGGGAERVVCHLANYLAKQQHIVEILTVSDKISYKPNDNVRVRNMYHESNSKLPKKIINIIRLYRFNKYLRKENVDLYVTFLPELTQLLMRQKVFFKAPVVISERSDPYQYWEKGRNQLCVFKKCFSRGDGYVFQTEEARLYYSTNGIDTRNSIVIPNAINPDFVKEPYIGKHEKEIVSVGRLNIPKNFPLLIRAFAKISEKHQDYILKIYGQGGLLESLKKLTRELGVEKKVEFPGYVNDIPKALQKASLFVLSSHYEGMPNALAEAMSLGLPCISTDCPVGGPRFLINEEENGILVPVDDDDALADAIERVLNNEDLKEKLGKNARHISERLSSDKIYNMWEEFLVRTANNKNR